MKVLMLFFTLMWSLSCLSANNAIKMAYNFTTVSQTVVFNQAMKAGGTFTLSTQAKDGGGRGPGDPFVLRLVFYNSSNAIVNTSQLSNTLVYGATELTTYTMTTTNCGGSCANVAYVSVQFYGKDGGYWAGNYGPYITNPSLTFSGSGNLLYNPEFGTYTGSGTTYAQGWTSSAGWQNCALYSGSSTCVIDLGGTVNAAGGGYSSTGGTTSGNSGGYVAPTTPTLCCGGSSAAFSASTTNVNMVNQFNQRTTADSRVLVEQIGNFNITTIQQTGTKNNYVHVYTDGSTNTTNITQSGNASTVTNYVDLNISGNNNTTNITQSSTGGAKGAFVSETDNNNNIKIQQKDAGNHYASVTVSGGNKTVDITQQGSAAHMSNVTLSGNATSLNLTQSGSTQQYYGITHNCATAGGCAAITVIQGQ